MKKITLTIVATIITILVFSQAPQAFKYQAVVRDNAGNILSEQNVSFKIVILKDSMEGIVVYRETHDTITNQLGLVTLEIGNGDVLFGIFEDINWEIGQYFLKILMDENGGVNYQLMGISQLLSVPFALYAESSGDAGGTDIDDLLDGRTIGNSVYLGLDAGTNDDGTDNRNVAVGLNTLKESTEGERNAVMGYNALSNNTLGNHNSAFGYQALLNNTEGNRNTAIGYQTLLLNTTGEYNTAIGHNANFNNEEGSKNTIVGYQAGMGSSPHSNSGNVFLGYQAGYHEITNNKLYIDNSDTVSPLIYGEFDNDILGFNGQVGIGTNNPYSWSKLDVRGNLSVVGNAYINHSDAIESILNLYNTISDWEIVAADDNNRFDIRQWGGIPVLSITENDFVGIGTTNPSVKLDIRGSHTDDGVAFQIGNSDQTHRMVLFGGRENDPNPFIMWKEGDPLRFSTDEEGWSEKMRITSSGQVGVGTETPDSSALVDLNSNSKGFLIPRMTESEISQIPNPANGLQVFNTDDGKLYIYVSNVSWWKEVQYGAGIIPGPLYCPENISDIDGNTYNVVQIGNQCWMAENLKTTTYNNGTPIPNVPEQFNWENLVIGAYVWYNNDISFKDKYGALYNWYATVDPNGLCPIGWHVSTESDWNNLINYIGGLDSPHGNELKSCRQVSSPLGGDCNTSEHPRWDPDDEHFGTDVYSFSGLPGGQRTSSSFYFQGIIGVWWFLFDSSNYPGIFALENHIGSLGNLGSGPVNFGISVRCCRDN